MLNKLDYYAAVLSDVHLCHDRTDTRRIVSEIKTYFPDDSSTEKLDTIYIAGDWFDKLITYPNENLNHAEDAMIYLLKLCKKRNIQLRVLEGTPSHDWKQPKRFLHLNKRINADLKYFETLDIEHNNKFGIDVLYIPDEYDPDTNKTFIDVKKKMTSLGLEKVDLAIMHGQFKYQLPEIAKVPKHDEKNYLDIVKYYITIGHVHTFSTFDRIIAQGSFSRLAHGEENPKGHVRFHLYQNGDMNYEFIENKEATKYITIDVRNMEVSDAITKIKNITSELPSGSYIRLRANKNDPILIKQNLDLLSMNEYGMIWTKSVIDDPDTKKNNISNNEFNNFIPITLTKENIVQQLLSRMEQKGYDKKDISLVNEMMKGSL